MPSPANKIKLGELLIDAGIITSGDLTEAIQVSRRLGVPIGQALLVSRCVTDNVLEAALEAQPLVKDGSVTRNAAVDALRRSYESGAPLRNYLEIAESNEDADTQQTSKRLAELLLDSEIVNQDQVDQALMTSYSSGMPLGSALVLEGVLSPSLFPSILRIQRNIREGKVGREEGIDELRSTFLHWIKAEESLARQAEMEDSADVYSQEEEEDIIQSGPSYAQPAYAPPMYTQPTFAPPTYVSRKSESFGLQDNEPGIGAAPRLIDLLKEAGALSHDDVQQAFDRILEDPIASGKLFKLLGVADNDTIKTAMKSHSLVEKHKLSDDEAVTAIKATHDEHEHEHDEHNGDESEADDEPRMKRYADRNWRKSTATKVLGGIAVGAAVAGLSSLFKRPRPKR